MTLGMILAMGALLVGALADLIYRVAQQRGIDTGNFIFWQAMVFNIALWSFGLATGQLRHIDATTLAYGLPAGMLAYVGLYLFVLSLRTGDASVNAPVFRLNFVITAAGGILLLGEAATGMKLLGIALAVFAVAALLNLRALQTSGAARSSLFTVVIAALLFGTVGILAKQALNAGSAPIPLMLVQTFTFTGSAIAYILFTRRWRPNRPTRNFAPLLGLLQLAWTVLLFQALARGEASIAYPIVQLSFVLTAVLAVLFLGEAATRAKIGGLALAVLAVGALAFA